MFGFAFMAVIAVMFSAVADPWIARLSWQGIAAMAMYGALASPAARLSRSWLRRTWDNLGRPSDLD